jgi:phosphoglycolate phosphatase
MCPVRDKNRQVQTNTVFDPAMKKYDALIFDLDGTLWNVNDCCVEAWNIMLEKAGYRKKITVKEMDSVTGKPDDEIVDILLPELRGDKVDFISRTNVIMKEVMSADHLFIYPGVIEKLPELARQYRIFIVSNCQRWYLMRFIEYSGLEKVLSGWDCFGMSGIEKYRMISGIKERHGIERAVYLGDTLLDHESAVLSGTDFIQVTYGFGRPIDGEEHFDSFIDLSKYLMFRAEGTDRRRSVSV